MKRIIRILKSEKFRRAREEFYQFALDLLRQPVHQPMSHDEAMISSSVIEMAKRTGLPLEAAAWLVRTTEATRTTHPDLAELDVATLDRGFVAAWARTAPSGWISPSEKKFNRWRGSSRGWDSFFRRTLDGLTACAGEPFDLRSLYDVAALRALCGEDRQLTDFARFYAGEFARNQPTVRRAGAL